MQCMSLITFGSLEYQRLCSQTFTPRIASVGTIAGIAL